MNVTSIAIEGMILVAIWLFAAVGPGIEVPVGEAGNTPLFVKTINNKKMSMPCVYTVRAELAKGSVTL